MAPDREWVLEATHTILGWFHTIHLQTMHEVGGVREVDRSLTQTLLAKFGRLQLVVGEDFTQSLMALHADVEASSMTLVSDIVRTLNLHPEDTVSHQLRAALRQFQQTTSLKFVVPLTVLEVAHKGLEAFMQRRLHELSSQIESQTLIGELSQKLTDKALQVQELVQVPELMDVEVFQQVILGLMAQQPLKSNTFQVFWKG